MSKDSSSVDLTEISRLIPLEVSSSELSQEQRSSHTPELCIDVQQNPPIIADPIVESTSRIGPENTRGPLQFRRWWEGEFAASALFSLFVWSAVLQTAPTAALFITLLWKSLIIGVGASVIIFAFGDICWVHFNPAISIVTSITGSFPDKTVALKHAGVQIFGSLAGSLLTACVFARDVRFGSMGSVLKAIAPDPIGEIKPFTLWMELVCTAIFLLVVCLVTTDPDDSNVVINHNCSESHNGESNEQPITSTKSLFAPIVIGATLFLLIMVGGSAGPCMNPAIMVASCILNFEFAPLFPYIFAWSLSIGLVWILVTFCLRKKRSCSFSLVL